MYKHVFCNVQLVEIRIPNSLLNVVTKGCPKFSCPQKRSNDHSIDRVLLSKINMKNMKDRWTLLSIPFYDLCTVHLICTACCATPWRATDRPMVLHLSKVQLIQTTQVSAFGARRSFRNVTFLRSSETTQIVQRKCSVTQLVWVALWKMFTLKFWTQEDRQTRKNVPGVCYSCEKVNSILLISIRWSEFNFENTSCEIEPVFFCNVGAPLELHTEQNVLELLMSQIKHGWAATED